MKNKTSLRFFLLSLIYVLMTSQHPGRRQTAALRTSIEGIVAEKRARVAVSIRRSDGKEVVSIYGKDHCPMQSVFKMHISLAVLAEVDKGILKLDQLVEVRGEDLLPVELWSPLRDEYPEGGLFTIARLIQYAISQSDNVACDVLIRLLGAPANVEHYFRSQGFKDLSVVYNEKEMQAKWENMFQNWTTVRTSGEILQRYYANRNGELSPASHRFFWQTMRETTTGIKRLKGLLPEGTVVAHKTGSSGSNEAGLTAATNDMGVVFLPNGDYFFIAVFVADSYESDETNERIIAEIAKAAYECFYNDGAK